MDGDRAYRLRAWLGSNELCLDELFQRTVRCPFGLVNLRPMQEFRQELHRNLQAPPSLPPFDPSLMRLELDLNLPNNVQLHLSLNNLVFHQHANKRQRMDTTSQLDSGIPSRDESLDEPAFCAPLDLKFQSPCCFHTLQKRHQRVLASENRIPTIFARSLFQGNEMKWAEDHSMFDPLVCFYLFVGSCKFTSFLVLFKI